ncbi:PREDICTED: mitotic interactor and substrate of PLK1 [Condylura cristata]|uniref:mitotic interactor and substrate of PLK1 n=1 Tax=Condylura cristata TaxID=143302 RepID=UPI0003345951|nr:PREDICTED: mitotic interactor and substrate of PLK1 [Condylura cristata]
MDRVTRYPLFSHRSSPRVTSLALDGDHSYTFEMVGVGPEASDWSQGEPQVWRTDRKARPEAVQTGVTRTLQASNSRLRSGANKDENIKASVLDSAGAQTRKPWDLEQEPRAVIRGQAVKRSGTVATLHGTPDNRAPKTPGQPQLTSLSENAVDTEQIDFLAVRQQFLNLEQANGEAPQSPRAKAAPVHTTPPVSQAPKALNRLPQANGFAAPAKPQVKELIVEEKSSRGWPAGSDRSVQGVDSPDSWPQEEETPEPPKETPIEREIRLTQERERDLREQRGLRPAASHQELVEIPTKPLLTNLSLTTTPRRDHRRRQSLYVQRDMAQETQREENHRREGLHIERAATPDWASKRPQPGLRRAFSSDSILSLAPPAPASAADPPPRAKKVSRIPPDAYHPYGGSRSPQLESPDFRSYGKPRGLPEDEAKTVGSAQRHLPGLPGKTSGTKQEHRQQQEPPLAAKAGVLRREYFLLRSLQFKVPDTPQQSEEPRVEGWQAARASLHGLQRSPSSELLEREVEDVLRREREVAEERRNARFPRVFSPAQDEDSDQESTSSQTSGTVGSYCVNETDSFSPTRLHSGLVWTAEAPRDDGSGQTKKEQWYAGLKPSDHVNSEGRVVPGGQGSVPPGAHRLSSPSA